MGDIAKCDTVIGHKTQSDLNAENIKWIGGQTYGRKRDKWKIQIHPNPIKREKYILVSRSLTAADGNLLNFHFKILLRSDGAATSSTSLASIQNPITSN